MEKIHLYVQTCCRSHPDPQQWTFHADGQVSSVWNKYACDKICVLLGNAPVPFNSHVWSTDFIYNEWKGTEFVKSALYISTTPSKATVHIWLKNIKEWYVPSNCSLTRSISPLVGPMAGKPTKSCNLMENDAVTLWISSFMTRYDQFDMVHLRLVQFKPDERPISPITCPRLYFTANGASLLGASYMNYAIHQCFEHS